jgi:hypothetical protein
MNSYKNLTEDQKKICMEVISKLLGLGADVTLERITPAVAKKVDEFLSEASACSDRIAALGYLSNLISGGSILNFVGLIGAALDIIARIHGWAKGANVIFAGCYFVLKRKYAQEIQYLFFMGE